MCFHMLHFLYLYMLFVGKLVKQPKIVFETPLLGLGPRHFILHSLSGTLISSRWERHPGFRHCTVLPIIPF